MLREISMLWNVGVTEGELPKEIYSDPPIRRMHHAMGPATQLESWVMRLPNVWVDEPQSMEI
jgi:hypothetical protein